MTQIAIEERDMDPINAPQVLHTIPKIDITAFCRSADLAEAIRTGALDRRMVRASLSVRDGGMAEAASFYRGTPSPNLVVVESHEQNGKLMAELEALALECIAGTKVIVIGSSNDVNLYRELVEAGVDDYLVAPVAPMAFVEAVSRCFRNSVEQKLGRIIAFIGAKGGSGSSTIAHNVAAAMVDRSDADVLVADLDLQFGTVGLDFDVDAPQGMADVIDGVDRVDEVLLKRIAVKHSERLHLLPVNAAFDRSFNLKEEDVDRLLDVARSSSWHLVLDIPHLWTPWTKKALLSADEIVITATPDLASMRNAKNIIEFLKKARPNDPPPRLVLNRVGTPKLPEVKLKDFAAAVGVEQWVTVPFDAPAFGKAANEGRMVTKVARGSKAARAMSELAWRVSGQRDKRSGKKFQLQAFLGTFRRRRWQDKLPFANGKAAELASSESGVSAVEFALIAPVLAFSLVAMADVGLALHERTAMDHALRAGAQAAMSDPGEAAVQKVMESTLGQTGTSAGVTFDLVKRYCACPENADVAPADAPACTVSCASSAAPFVFYRLQASKTYDAMSLPEILADFRLSSSAEIQIQ
ncbi:AAA family ATPase [Nitratireductor sp. ZSWI3]|uniref:AAA family ATPase n=1 Tax=Nitratireductor sp. ZSWI3 TaxID=2966359 RepID=UPI00214FC721|nr:AAA family ATPase [Nitratireductor sp. ZSWI3]MCR4264733.1 AAA family ATPase [Nitratireductor sp. ZSWI3]